MKANPECLILEDEPRRLEALRIAVHHHGMHPMPAPSASKALSILENAELTTRPVLAIIDINLRFASDQDHDAFEVLRSLYDRYPECLTVVYSAGLSEARLRAEVTRSHPRAYVQDKDHDGDDELFLRLTHLLTKRIGDLVLDEGTVRHDGGAEHHHRIAVALMLNHPKAVTVAGDSASRAVRRFRQWLDDNGSVVSLRGTGTHKFRLEVADAPQ